MNNSPLLWQELLKSCPKNAYLMGGAVVDFALGYEAKDYDIFQSVHTNFTAKPGNWKYIPPVDQAKRLEEYDIEAKDGKLPILSVEDFDVSFADGVFRVQIITLDYENPLDYIKNFDHTLTLGAYGRNGLKVSSRVFSSMETRTVKLLNNKNAEKSLLRAQRKIAKYDPVWADNWTYEGWPINAG